VLVEEEFFAFGSVHAKQVFGFAIKSLKIGIKVYVKRFVVFADVG